MKNLTGNSASFVAQKSFETGDGLNETNFDAALQSAADRAQYLLVNLGITQETLYNSGIQKIRAVTSSANLKALTGMATGDVALITPASVSTMGLYVFVTTIPLGADIAGWAYDANNSSGYWLRADSPLMVLGGQGGNQPRLNSSLINAPNRIAGWIDFYESGSPLSVDSDGNWQNSGFVSDPFAVQQGDIVDITAHVSVSFDSATDEFEMRLATDDQTSVAAIANTNLVVSPRNVSAKVPVTLRGRFTAQSSVNHTVRVQLSGPGGGPIAMVIGAKRSFKGMIVRP